MNDNVVNLDEHLPHLQGRAHCTHCKHEWQAVAPVETHCLECPSCELDRGVWKGLTMPADGELWVCSCGCSFFVLTETKIMCSLCGRPQSGMWDSQGGA